MSPTELLFPAWRPGEPLASRSVRIILADTEGLRASPYLSQYHVLLSEEEDQRRKRFHFERDRHLYLVSHALCRLALASLGQVSAASLQFVANEHGRPEIARPAALQRLRFNLSHTHGMAALALAWDCDIGVDVEDCQRPGVGVDIAKAYFSPAEVVYLAGTPPDETRETFFTFWTLKEAYIKARGMGLALPLDKFSFSLAGEEQPTITCEPELQDRPEEWHFRTWKATSRHALALAVRSGPGKEFPVDICQWDGRCPPGV